MSISIYKFHEYHDTKASQVLRNHNPTTFYQVFLVFLHLILSTLSCAVHVVCSLPEFTLFNRMSVLFILRLDDRRKIPFPELCDRRASLFNTFISLPPLSLFLFAKLTLGFNVDFNFLHHLNPHHIFLGWGPDSMECTGVRIAEDSAIDQIASTHLITRVYDRAVRQMAPRRVLNKRSVFDKTELLNRFRQHRIKELHAWNLWRYC